MITPRHIGIEITYQPRVKRCSKSGQRGKTCGIFEDLVSDSSLQDLSSTISSNQRSAYTEQQASQGQLQQMQQRQQQTPGSSAEAQDSVGASQSAEQPPLSQMSELDRFGLAGLLRMIHSESPDVASLAVGQDLMTLGLDLNQPEYVSNCLMRV